MILKLWAILLFVFLNINHTVKIIMNTFGTKMEGYWSRIWIKFGTLGERMHYTERKDDTQIREAFHILSANIHVSIRNS